MVGVPALALWLAGPSSRMCWPISRRRSHRIRSGRGQDGQPEGHAPRGHEREHRSVRSSTWAPGGGVAGSGSGAPTATARSSKGTAAPRRPPGRSRGPCRRAPPRHRTGPRRAPTRWPGAGRARPPGGPRPMPPGRRSAPATISSMMAAGSSSRGLSEVTMVSVAPVRPPPPPSAAAWPGPGPRRTRRPRAPGRRGRSAARHSSSTTPRAGRGVGEVDQDAERGPDPGPRRPPLRGARGPAGPPPARPRPVRDRCPAASAASAASSALSTLTAPVIGSTTDRPRQVKPVRPGARVDVRGGGAPHADHRDAGLVEQPPAPTRRRR